MPRVLTILPVLLVAAAGDQPPHQDVRLPDELRQKAAASAERALRWLLRAQNSDGSFGDNPRAPGDVSNTSIAILALLATGSTETRGPHWRPLRRATGWLLRQTAGEPGSYDRTTLIQAKLGQNADLYLAALACSQLLGTRMEAGDETSLHQRLARMVEHIAGLQRPDGQWETSYEPTLTTIAAWLALRQAHAAGITIQHAAPEKVVDYLERQTDPAGMVRDAKWGNRMRFVTQAGALRVFLAEGREKEPLVQKAIGVLQAMRFDQDVGGNAGGEEFLGALYATHAMRLASEKEFGAWFGRIVPALVRCQNQDGSWVGHHCITGRVFCTAAALVALRTPDDLLMLAQR